MGEPDEYLDTAELAARWKMQPATLRSWRNRGAGPAFIKPGGKALYAMADVLAWEARKEAANA